jgi:hypothetical protein
MLGRNRRLDDKRERLEIRQVNDHPWKVIQDSISL